MIPRFYNTAVATEHYLGMRWPRAIWQAVLEQAIRDILEGPSEFETRGLMPREAVQLQLDFQAAAQHWVDDEENEPRRFEWVCDHLNLDPQAVRTGIKRRKEGNGESA